MAREKITVFLTDLFSENLTFGGLSFDLSKIIKVESNWFWPELKHFPLLVLLRKYTIFRLDRLFSSYGIPVHIQIVAEKGNVRYKSRPISTCTCFLIDDSDQQLFFSDQFHMYKVLEEFWFIRFLFVVLKGPVDLGSKKENAVELLNNLRWSQCWPYFDSKPKIDEVIEEIDLFMVWRHLPKWRHSYDTGHPVT